MLVVELVDLSMNLDVLVDLSMSNLWIYLFVMSLMIIVIYIMLVMNIMIYIYIWCLWWILWIYYASVGDFICGKQKNCKGHFALRFLGRRTTKWPNQQVGIVPLPCVYWGGARQRSHLCCAFLWWCTAKGQSLLCVFVRTHGKGPYTPFAPTVVTCFCFPCASPWRTTKIVHRALSDKMHDNRILPCKNLSCALCRAPRRKTQDKYFIVCFLAFARQTTAFP
jgi:hypothetical protein